MEFEVSRIFDAWIRARFQGRDQVLAWLLGHERKRRCVEAVCGQIRIAELSNIGRRFDAWRYRQVIEACAAMFCDAALRHAEEQAMSRLERQRLEAQANAIKEAEGVMRDLEAEATSTKLISRPGDVAR